MQIAPLILWQILMIAQLKQQAAKASLAVGESRIGTLEDDLAERACELDTNETMKYEFYTSVRKIYGNTESPEDTDRYSVIQRGARSKVRCYAGCKGATIVSTTWCVHLFHSTEQPVAICLNSTAIVSQTPAAQRLGLGEKLNLTRCDRAAGCLSISESPYYLNNAYLVCITSDKSSCARQTFVEVTVDVSTPDVSIIDVARPTGPLMIGDALSLTCRATAGYHLSYLEWVRNRDNHVYGPIYEDPFCNATVSECWRDINPFTEDIRKQSIRAYSLLQTEGICLNQSLYMTSYLVFDGISEEDVGDYSCVATNTFQKERKISRTITLSTGDAAIDNIIVPHLRRSAESGFSSSSATEGPSLTLFITFALIIANWCRR